MKPIAFIAAMLLCPQTYAQVYTEDFSNQEGIGIRGLCSVNPLSCDTFNLPSPTGWTITGNASGLLNSEDYVMVNSEELVARDTDAELCFQSPLFSLEECDSVDIAVLIEETGDLEASDHVDVYVVVDSIQTFIPDILGIGDSTHTITGDIPDDQDWQSIVVGASGFSGDSLMLIVCLRNNSGTETIRLDDLDVSCSISAIAPEVYISEVDCDQPGQDTAEFIELAGPAGQELDGIVLVLFNGSDDASYASYSMEGEVLNGQGLFTVCFGTNSGEYCDLIASGQMQNGADGVGLYYGRGIEDFPNDTPLDSFGLIDGLRYSTGESVDTGLAMLDMDSDCSENCQIDEEPAEYSIQRGSWFVAPPTPGELNADPLSVTWRSFTAVYRNGTTYLDWSTETEFHNAYFSIEHARDRQAFAEIGRVDGHHSSNTEKTYHWRHQPQISVANHYYRIRAVDENGNSDYSAIRVVQTLSEIDIRIWPTATKHRLHVEWPLDEPAEVVMYSLDGKAVYRSKKSKAGYLEIDVSNLEEGIYIARFITNDRQVSRKVLVQQ